jgi:hypothetical protein
MLDVRFGDLNSPGSLEPHILETINVGVDREIIQASRRLCDSLGRLLHVEVGGWNGTVGSRKLVDR